MQLIDALMVLLTVAKNSMIFPDFAGIGTS
jgi:hypothetical protein